MIGTRISSGYRSVLGKENGGRYLEKQLRSVREDNNEDRMWKREKPRVEGKRERKESLCGCKSRGKKRRKGERLLGKNFKI